MNMSEATTRRQSGDLNIEKMANMGKVIHGNSLHSIRMQPRQSTGHNFLLAEVTELDNCFGSIGPAVPLVEGSGAACENRLYLLMKCVDLSFEESESKH